MLSFNAHTHTNAHTHAKSLSLTHTLTLTHFFSSRHSALTTKLVVLSTQYHNKKSLSLFACFYYECDCPTVFSVLDLWEEVRRRRNLRGVCVCVRVCFEIVPVKGMEYGRGEVGVSSWCSQQYISTEDAIQNCALRTHGCAVIDKHKTKRKNKEKNGNQFVLVKRWRDVWLSVSSARLSCLSVHVWMFSRVDKKEEKWSACNKHTHTRRGELCLSENCANAKRRKKKRLNACIVQTRLLNPQFFPSIFCWNIYPHMFERLLCVAH
jgi:hypothetical protein